MRLRFPVLLLCCATLLGGCGGKNYTYADGRDLKEGPGLLSGKDGVFTLYNSGQAEPQATPQTIPSPDATGKGGNGNKAP